MAALYLEDAETDELHLGNIIKDLVDNSDKLCELQNNSKRLAKYDGVENIVEQLVSIV